MPNDDQFLLGKIATDIDNIKKDIGEIKEDVKESKNVYVTKVEFEPVKKIVYTAAGFILLAVLGALVYLVIKQ